MIRLKTKGRILFNSFIEVLDIDKTLGERIILRNNKAYSFISDEECLNLSEESDNLSMLLGITLFRKKGELGPITDEEIKILRDTYGFEDIYRKINVRDLSIRSWILCKDFVFNSISNICVYPIDAINKSYKKSNEKDDQMHSIIKGELIEYELNNRDNQNSIYMKSHCKNEIKIIRENGLRLTCNNIYEAKIEMVEKKALSECNSNKKLYFRKIER